VDTTPQDLLVDLDAALGAEIDGTIDPIGVVARGAAVSAAGQPA
jgi:hypothetical protein